MITFSKIKNKFYVCKSDKNFFFIVCFCPKIDENQCFLEALKISVKKIPHLCFFTYIHRVWPFHVFLNLSFSIYINELSYSLCGIELE